MKRILLLAAVFALLSSPAAFGRADGPGCGVGQQIWAGESGLAAHLMAYTTNMTFSQPSAILSETSDCDGSATVQLERERRQFVQINLDNLALEMARGEGAYLESLASLMGCGPVKAAFLQATRERYPSLNAANPDTLLEGLEATILHSPVLAAGCTVS